MHSAFLFNHGMRAHGPLSDPLWLQNVGQENVKVKENVSPQKTILYIVLDKEDTV